MAAIVETGARVTTVTRHGMDKVTSRGRDEQPFAAFRRHGARHTRRDLARAVIDASGTWTNPNPLGGSGLPAEGELEHADGIAYGIPDVLGRDRAAYAGRRVIWSSGQGIRPPMRCSIWRSSPGRRLEPR